MSEPALTPVALPKIAAVQTAGGGGGCRVEGFGIASSKCVFILRGVWGFGFAVKPLFEA